MRLSIFVALVVAGCGSPAEMPAALAPTDGAALRKTLDDLAVFGEKHVGTEGATRAGEMLLARFSAAGLGGAHFESFDFPRHDLVSSSLSVTVDGAPQSPGFDVFEGCGSGHADGDVVWVGAAMDADLAGVDLTGKIAMVQRIQSFHRSSQYRNVAAKGAVAMLYQSAAQDNLRQVGSVRLTFESLGPIPAITIGADDGKALHAALDAKKTVRAVIDVQVKSTP